MKHTYSATLCGLSSTFVIGTGLLFSGVVVAPPALANLSSLASAQLEFASLRVLGHEELEARRGGFNFAGLKFEFGANIRSYFDNRLVLESLISITRDGVTQQQVMSQPPVVSGEGAIIQLPLQSPDTTVQSVSGVKQSNAAEMTTAYVPASVPGDGTIPQQMQGADTPVQTGTSVVQSNAVAAEVPATIDLSGLRDAVGVSLNDQKGFTTALHQATRERITSLIVNTASGRDIRQELDVRIDVANFRQFQNSARQAILNSRFGAAALK